MKNINFDDWWFNGGYEITERIYGIEASKRADIIDPDKIEINIYSDELEKLARENNLHLKTI